MALADPQHVSAPFTRQNHRIACRITPNRKIAEMSAKQRFLRDESGAVFAEWVVITAVIVTLCLVALTAWRGEADLAHSQATVVVKGV